MFLFLALPRSSLVPPCPSELSVAKGVVLQLPGTPRPPLVRGWKPGISGAGMLDPPLPKLPLELSSSLEVVHPCSPLPTRRPHEDELVSMWLLGRKRRKAETRRFVNDTELTPSGTGVDFGPRSYAEREIKKHRLQLLAAQSCRRLSSKCGGGTLPPHRLALTAAGAILTTKHVVER